MKKWGKAYAKGGVIGTGLQIRKDNKAKAMAQGSDASAPSAPSGAMQGARSLFEELVDDTGVLEPEGVGKLFMYMGEHSEFRPAILRELWVPMKLALAQGGRFIAPGKTSLVLQSDESVLYDAPAEVMKEVIDREMRGSYQGISVPLGHGVRYRTGAGRGRMETIGSHWTTADKGTLTLTDSRVVYHGMRQTLEFPLQKLADLSVYGDAIAIGATNRKSNSHFRMGNPELAAGLIQGAVSHLGEITVIRLELEEAEGPDKEAFEITRLGA